MLEHGTIALTETQQRTLDDLDVAVVSLTRRDPGETGPVVVTLADGDTFELEED